MSTTETAADVLRVEVIRGLFPADEVDRLVSGVARIVSRSPLLR